MRTRKYRIISVVVLVLLLAAVRLFEQDLFYDPFLYYFKSEFANVPFPAFDSFKLLLSLSCRYGLNSLISLGILYAAFRDFELAKFTSVLYLLLFVVLTGLFFGVINFADSENPFLLFYVRRFLIQPVFILLFLPAFYYQKNR